MSALDDIEEPDPRVVAVALALARARFSGALKVDALDREYARRLVAAADAVDPLRARVTDTP